jgi:hypothetical protein
MPKRTLTGHVFASVLGPATIALFLATPAGAQLTAAAGYTKIAEVGEESSEQGPAARLGLYLGARRAFSFGLEVGFDRLGEGGYMWGPQSCLLPGGGTGDCFGDFRAQDNGLSLSVIARYQVLSPGVSPYFLVGFGGLRTRSHVRQVVTDGAGNRLPNFEFDVTRSESNAMAHLGAGVAVALRGSPVMLTLEGRVSPVLYNSDGSPGIAFGRSLLAGVRLNP